LSRDYLRAKLKSVYLGLLKKPSKFNNLFLELQNDHVIYSVPHLLVQDFKKAAKEELRKDKIECEVVLVSGTIRALRDKAGQKGFLTPRS